MIVTFQNIEQPFLSNTSVHRIVYLMKEIKKDRNRHIMSDGGCIFGHYGRSDGLVSCMYNVLCDDIRLLCVRN